jgi:hypothetical protein
MNLARLAAVVAATTAIGAAAAELINGLGARIRDILDNSDDDATALEQIEVVCRDLESNAANLAAAVAANTPAQAEVESDVGQSFEPDSFEDSDGDGVADEFEDPDAEVEAEALDAGSGGESVTDSATLGAGAQSTTE